MDGDDRELLDRIRKCDGESFGVLFNRTHRWLLQFVILPRVGWAEALNASSPDPQKVASLQLTVKGHRDQIRAADETLGAGFKALLTPAKRAKPAQVLAMKDTLPVLMALGHMGF